MTQVVFSAVGGAIAGPAGATIGGMIGGFVDHQIMTSMQPARQIGPRLEGLKVQSSAEGQPLPCVFGRARVTGQIMWAARFNENKRKQTTGKNGKTYDYAYSLSFAVGLGEGEIDGIGRIWADGMPMDMSGVQFRLYRGGETQMPDPLIELIEGEAPAYRGTAYLVFEDFQLEAYGNRVPQLSVEVFRRARGSTPRLEDRLEGVCLIPGAGEFVLASELVKRRLGITRSAAENNGAGQGRADLEVSLDQLVTQLPNVRRVNLVVGWFGTDVRAGHCQIRPGVEQRGKVTAPFMWEVAGLNRSTGHVVSQLNGAPAYGGTPSDESVRQAIRSLKARGLEVVLYPFVFMDCEGYPWRGRVKGTDGSGAASEVGALFGSAEGWGLRRQVLHYAQMAKQEGAHGLVIGSEMRGLTQTRDAQGGFPAVAQYKTLAAECRAIVGSSVKLTYAADWSEYAGLRQGGEVRFHLDPLWADANIDFVGIDWYPPMGDWREGEGGVDAQTFAGPWDENYLAGQVAGGRDYDWYYASEEDAQAQRRTPITDGEYGEPWVWRVKDIKGWWQNRHYERVDGVRQAEPTPWLAGMKPVRLMEFGCAAVDRGGNAPNLFQDAKSSESHLPPWSDGSRDDRMQRALLEAVLGHFDKAQNNPVSSVYGGRMLSGADVWCWDARPWPAFPAREDIWSDAGAWRTGHWLNGRVQGTAADMVEGLLERAGLRGRWRVEGIDPSVSGLVIERPMTTRAVLAMMLTGLGAVASERDGDVVVSGAVDPVMTLRQEALALPEDGASIVREREVTVPLQAVRVRYVQETGDYQTGAVLVRSDRMEPLYEREAPLNHVQDFDLACVVSEAVARTAALRLLKAQQAEKRVVRLGPLEALKLEAGDVVALEGEAGLWRVMSIAYEEQVSAVLVPVVRVAQGDAVEDWRGGGDDGVVGAPWLRVLDLPALPGQETDARPIVVAAADPWWPMTVHVGADVESLVARGLVAGGAVVGALLSDLSAGPVDRWDEGAEIHLRFEGGSVQSVSEHSVLNGSNLLAVETAVGWELVQFRQAIRVGDEEWRLKGLLRGRQGSDEATRAGAVVGAGVVLIEPDLMRVDMNEGERGLERLWRVGPQGLAPGGADFTSTRFVWQKVQARPWSPVHLKGEMTQAGLVLSWTARNRLGGENWDQDDVASDPERFRLRVMQDQEVLRQWEAEGSGSLYEQAQMTADLSSAEESDVRIEIAQWSDVWGWGAAGVYAVG